MKIRFGRAAVAGLATIALMGTGIAAAAAADSIPSDPRFAGTWYPADDNEVPIAPGTTLQWSSQVVAQAIYGDINTALKAPSDATGYKYFLVQQGHEYDMTYYSASSTATFSGDMVEPNLTPTGLINAAGSNAPVAGQGAVKAAGGAYSLGLAFTKNSGVTIANHGVYFIHIAVAPGGAYTFSQVEVAKTSTTTTLVAPASATENTAVTLSAAVAPTAATGTVQFKDGATDLGSPVALNLGGATLTLPSGLSAGSHSISAVYSGDSTYATSSSAPSTIAVAGAPVSTTLALTAVSATGKASENVVYTATVSPAAATGSVAFSAQLAGGATVALGSSPVSNGVATLTVGGLPAGSWTVTAAFTGTGVYQPSSATTPLTLEAPSNSAAPDPQTVSVVVPVGTLTITTPWTPENPLLLGDLELNQKSSTWQLKAPKSFASATDQGTGIQILNLRANSPHFTAQVASTDFTSPSGSFAAGTASLINVAAHQVTDNAVKVADVHPTDVTALANTAQTFAQYGGSTLGTAWLSADLNIAGVPSSTPAGTYTATVTFTAF